jgi:hypothetical protein
MTGLYLASELLARNRFTNDVATDAKLRAEFLLGGQTLPGRQAFIQYTGSQLLRDFIW